jgi:hypothetical protein
MSNDDDSVSAQFRVFNSFLSNLASDLCNIRRETQPTMSASLLFLLFLYGVDCVKNTPLPRARLQLIGGNRPDGSSALAFPAGVHDECK